MAEKYLIVKKSPPLQGTVTLSGAKNAVLVIIASLILTSGKSTLYNVPNSADVQCILLLMQELGAHIHFDTINKILTVDTSFIDRHEVSLSIMNKMRASILVMGPLLARFSKAKVALPGGCLIGARPINYHLEGFRRFGISLIEDKPFLLASKIHDTSSSPLRITLEYPSVGATENLLMYACLQPRETTIVNAALEPEVIDLIDVLRKMGAKIFCENGAFIRIEGVNRLDAVEHTIIPDRLEAGSLMLGACITKGTIYLPNALPNHLDAFIEKLREMGHTVLTGLNPTNDYPLQGIRLIATREPQAISIKTGPYPGFPTDLQAPMTAILTLSHGTSSIEETVFENRLLHVKELEKMGANINVHHQKITITGVKKLYGTSLIATDIRASCGLILAGLAAEEECRITGIHHLERGYDKLEHKFRTLGAQIDIETEASYVRAETFAIQGAT